MRNRIPTYSFNSTKEKESLAELFIWNSLQNYNIDESHSHTYNELLVFEIGGGTHLMSKNNNEIQNYSFHILPSSFVHHLNRTSTSKGFTIAFSDFFINQLQNFDNKSDYLYLVSEPKVFNFTENDYKEFEFYFKELHTQKENESYFLNLISLIILKILDKIKHKPNFKILENSQLEIIRLVNKYYQEKPKIEFYASKMNLSISCFSKKVKQLFGKTIIDLQNEKIILESKRLLKQNNLSVNEIASKLNFTDEAHFCHFFKKYLSLTPKEFKKSCFIQFIGCFIHFFTNTYDIYLS